MIKFDKASVENFVVGINAFENLPESKQADLFAYFLLEQQNNTHFTIKDIAECFTRMDMNVPTQISVYFPRYSKKSSRNKARYTKSDLGYRLERSYKEEISKLLGNIKQIRPTNDLFPLSVFLGTRKYIESVALQAATCYDKGIYDACLVMVRKLIEILIIENYERFGIEANIKNKDGEYLYLSDLISKFLSEKKWTVSRSCKQSLPEIKKYGDLCAHNRRFIAKKDDIEKIKDDLRIVSEELILLIDYPNWNRNR